MKNKHPIPNPDKTEITNHKYQITDKLLKPEHLKPETFICLKHVVKLNPIRD